MAENAPDGVSLILAGGLTPQNVSEGIRKVRPWGVDVASGVERKAGIKDPILVRDFIKEAKKTSQYLQSMDNNGDEIDDPYDWKEDPTWR